MYSRWYNVAVVLLWLAAMSWLMVEKVLPPLQIGHPPSYGSILAAQGREPPVGWRMTFNGRPLGWALSTMAQLPTEITEIHSHVHFDELPLREMAPGWLGQLVDEPVAHLGMEAHSALSIDPLGRLASFRSTLRINPLHDAIKLQGNVDGNRLKLIVGTGGLTYTTDVYLPPNALLGDALSPQTQLPGLRMGQSWTVPVYSPLRPPNSPIEVLQATVESRDRISWDGRTETAWLVVYRTDRGYGLGNDEKPRAKLWVRQDGTVLKQQVVIFNSRMTFYRLPENEAAALAERVGTGEDTMRRR
ncbi:MAG: hypothetical protein JXB62_19330 [Pirellulales bacterium]|nr:hypothetical protein [Pirellulales bacterium]